MKKITNLLVCLVLAVLASTNAAASIKVKVKAVDAKGAQINGKVLASNSDELDPAYGTGVYTATLDEESGFYLYAEDNGDYTFDSWWSSTAFGEYDDLENLLWGGLDEGSNTTKNVAFGYQGELEGEEDEDGYIVFYARFTTAGQTIFTPQYYKVKIVPRKHATGSSTMSNGGGKYYVSKTSSSSTWQTLTNGWTSNAFETGETNIIDFYLYAQNYDDYVFEGWYTDLACKTPLSFNGESSTKANGFHYTYTQADLDACDEGGDDVEELAPRRRKAKAASGTCPPVQFDLKSSSGTAVAKTIYAKFRDAFPYEYYKVRAQVVSPDGNTGGQVFLCDGDLWDDPDYTDDHYDSDYAYSSSRNVKVYVDLYAKAKDGYEFVGWYADEACTIPLSWNGNDYTQSEECTYSYKESNEDDFDLPLLFSTSTSSSSAPLNTVYAKFRSLEPQTYYAEVRYLADDNTPKHGAYFVTDKTVSNVPITATPLYSKTISLDSTTTAASVEYGKYPNTLPTYYIVPARGYIKNSWVLTNVDSHDGSLSNYQFNYRFNATSTDAANPTVVTLKHTYKDATLKTMNIVSPEGHGSIRFIARNWVENAAHTGLEWKTIDLGTAVGETAENIDFYNTDSIFITAVPDEGYQFREWVAWRIKEEEYEELATFDSPTYKSKGGGVVGGMKAYFDKQHHHYYAAEAEASKGGTVQVSFTNPISAEAGTYISGGTDWTLDESTEITVYAQATPKEGYRFVGWKTSPSGAMVSFDANYSTTFAATSQTESSPTTLKLYAYFQKDGEVEAKVFDQMGEVTKQGTFEYCLSNAGNNQTIVLYQNVELGSAQSIDENINIDFNGHTISGIAASLFTINSGKTVTFMDNSESRAGGITITTNSTSNFTGIFVKGTLNFYGGEIRCTNTSTTSTNPTRAIRVEGDGSTLNLQGGNIITNVANQQAHGVGVFNTGTALLESGSVSATAAKGTAYGVVTNGNLTVTWSVAISATVTSGNNATGVRVSNTNNYSKTVTISGGTITATASGSYAYAIHVTNSTATLSGNMAAIAEAGTATTAYTLYEEEANSKVTVETGRFKSNNTKDVYKKAGTLTLKGGYYAHNVDLNTYKHASVDIADLQPGTKFYDEGYRYILTDGENPNYVVATANGKNFGSVADAILYANNNPNTEMTILLTVPDATLPAGNYTIPAKATLLVPYKANQEPHSIVERVYMKAYVTPTPFCKLTLESGAHIDVYGTIETGGRQNAYQQSNYPNGAPTEAFGWLYLSNDSRIVVASGGVIRAWGYISGTGTMDIRRGAVVNELFQILDWKGGTHTRDMCNGGYMYNEGDVFPVNQYFIQSVESRTTYHPGSVLNTMAAICIPTLGYGLNADKVQIIGVRNHLDGSRDDLAMFLMDDEDDSENTWVCKYYDVAADRQVYEVNNSAALGSLDINFMGEYTFTSTRFTLPFTNNMTVRLLSGEMFLTQNSVMLAGMQIEVNKLSTFTIPAGDTLFVYDADQWDKFVFDGYYAQRVKYSPSVGGVPTARPEGGSKTVKPGDASINLKGTMLVEGAVYTTAGGANIYSTNEDAGTVTFSGNAAPSETAKVCQWNTGTYVYSDCPSALLKNANGTFTTTASTAAGTSFCYINGAWRNMEVEDECLVKDGDTYFAKPQDYVALGNNGEPNEETHLYVSEDGTRSFITTPDRDGKCQWWEVEPTEEDDNVFHCIHPENDVYYYYDMSEEAWVEKRCTVTWNNYDGTVIDSYTLNYKSTPKYLGTNPQRAMNDYYTYDFIGWTPEFVPVTRDITYTAQFEQKDRRYLVTFLDADGTELETSMWKMGEVPTCINQPTPQGKILNWEPAIRAVSGDATYRATYTDQLKSAYTITFVNWNGAELQSGSVTTGAIPAYSGTTPTKPSIQDEAYAFAGWTPDITAVSADAVYTATFTPAPAKYTITFKRAVSDNGEGTSISPAVEIETQELGYGELPVCSNPPVKNPTTEEYYEVIWTPQIASVTGDATYTATGFTVYKNTLRLTVSAGANGSVSVTKGGEAQELSAVYEAETAVVLTATPNTGYQFVRWSDGNISNPRDLTVDATTTLKAEFAVKTYTITWKDYDNSALGTTTVNHGEIPIYAAPARANEAGNSYAFNGWSPAVSAAIADAEYKATYTTTPVTYTVRFVLNNGMADVVRTGLAYNSALSIDDPVAATVGGVQGTFKGWVSSNGTTYAKGESLPNVTNNEVYSAQYELSAPEIILTAGTSNEADAKDIDISSYGTNVTASALIIEADGSATIPVGTLLQVEDIILESNSNKSGQLLGSSCDRLTLTGNAYFDLTLNTQRRVWYAVAVPWEVNAETGILDKATGRTLVLGRDFDLVYYKGDVRAEQGKVYGCWAYVEDETDKIMHPGRFYMMYFGSEIETLRFKSNDNTPFDATPDAVSTYAQSTGNESDANWNGIANPKVYHARLAAGGATYGYYLSNGNVDEYMADQSVTTYTLVNLASYTAIVGKPLYIQASEEGSIVANATIAAGAPRRIREIEKEAETGVENVYEVIFSAVGSSVKDNIFIRTAEEKAPVYTVGKDLVKAGVNAYLPQLWINRYDEQLAVNTTAAVNGIYDYPLTLNIPRAGEYRIAVADTQGEAEALYLTKDGEAIWNLSEGAYVGSFEKGEDASYGLRTGAKAPQITTGIDEAVVDAQGETKKVLINDKVYIIRGEKVYSVDGQLVK